MDRSRRRRISTSTRCRWHKSHSSGGESRGSSSCSQGSSSRSGSYSTLTIQSWNRKISPAARRALMQRCFPMIDWAETERLELATRGVSMMPCGKLVLVQ